VCRITCSMFPRVWLLLKVTQGRPLHSPVFESTRGPSLLLRDTSSQPGHLLFSNQMTRSIVSSITSARSDAV